MSRPRQQTKPRQLLLSKRANVFYLEHVRVCQKDDRIVYLTDRGEEVERFFNIPERNTAFLLLGKGTSITDAAARRMAESNVIVGFVGNGGSPQFSLADMTFLTPVSEYRPTEYMQAWAKLWFDESARLDAAKFFMRQRLDFTARQWGDNPDLLKRRVTLEDSLIARFGEKIDEAPSTAALMAVEGELAKLLYARLAEGFAMPGFTREEGLKSTASRHDLANSFLDHGNYIAYGYASVALLALGISFAFPVMHGKTRRGALVFDVADLFKDAIVMPRAFAAALSGRGDQDFRDGLIDDCLKLEVIDFAIGTIRQALALPAEA